MKYVKGRDSFLTGIKEYKETDNYKNLELIQEDGGPLHNAVEFGDSWVGRWLFNIMRAAKEKVDKMRIAGQIKRLRRALDDIIQYNESTKLEVIKKSKEKQTGKETGDPLKSDDLHDKFLKLQLHVFLDELNAAVEKGHKVSIIKGLTDFAIQEVKATPEFEGKKELLEQLEKFRKFLKDFDDDEGKDDPEFKKGEDEDEESDQEDKEDKSGDGLSTEKVFPAMIKCLKSLELVLINYKKLLTKDGKINIENKPTQKEVYTYTTKPGDTVEKIFKSPEINKNKLEIADIRKKNEKTLKTYAKDNQTLPPNLKLVMENVEILSEDNDCWYIVKDEKFIIVEKFDIIDEAKQIGQGAGANRNSFSPEDKYAIEAFGKLKASAEQLEKSGVTAQFLADITKQKMGGKEGKMYDLRKEPITDLFRQINRFLVGDKKATLNAPKDALYKENLESLSDNLKLVKTAENIATFAVRAQQFEKTGQNLYGAFGDLGEPLKEFAKTITEISKTNLGEEKSEKPKGELKFKVGDLVTWTNKEGKTITKKIEKIEDGKYVFKKENGEEYTKKEDSLKKAEPKEEGQKAEEAKKESRLLRFSNYYKLITEADDDAKDTGALSEVSRKILEFWRANVEVKQYLLSKEEFEKLIKELEDAEMDEVEVELDVQEPDPGSKTLKKGVKKKVKLTGLLFTIDPVLRIVKAFNKAYKLHTTAVIPSGRTTGAVSQRIFRQYTSLGGGDPTTAGKSGGPYRNNAVFNKWEEAVLDLLGESKYQKIFDPETKLLRGDTLVEKAGANLRLFMTDLLDGDELYKTKSSDSGKGAQSTFLDQYFGYKSAKANETNDGGEKEQEENNGTSSDIVDKTKKVQFAKPPIKFTQDSDLVGTIHKIEQGDKSYYMLIHELKGQYYYVTYTSGGYKFYHDLVTKQGDYGLPKFEEVKGDSTKVPKNDYKAEGGDEFIIKATRIPTNKFDKSTGTIIPREYKATYIKKKKDGDKAFTNKTNDTEKIDQQETIKVENGKVFILSYKEGKDDKEPKFVKIKNQASLSDKGIFPKITTAKDIDTVEIKSA